MCQLAFGNTRAAYINLRKSEVSWLTPPAYFVSSKIARRGFCQHCGTPLSFEFNGSQNMDLSVGSLDDPSVLRPVSRIAQWHVEDGLPGHRLDENETIAKRWSDAYGDDVVPGVDATRSD